MLEQKLLVYLAVWAVVWFFVWYIIWKIIKQIELRNERKRAVSMSRSVILWESYEKLVPISQAIPYHSKDMNFLWKWVDYVVFDGLSEWNLKKIIFLEVKTWKSRLNKNEKQIEQAIKNKKIYYEIVRLKNS
jgi:predicted Holliday junction resolvase-like endonuclease